MSSNVQENMFCKSSDLTNEASVEAWFVDKLIEYLGYVPDDIKLKTSLQEFKIGKGSKSALYKPDYIIIIEKFPTLVIDAKNPEEDINDWTAQCSSYCLELNKEYKHNPVEYFIISNGFDTSLFKWDERHPKLELKFNDFKKNNENLQKLSEIISKNSLIKISREKHDKLMESLFEFKVLSVDELSKLFIKIHNFIWKTEKKTPSAAFQELMKIIFIKIKKDKELFENLDDQEIPKVKDVVFSVAWIKNQTENDNPINNPLFKNLLKDLEKEIRAKNRKRFFDENDNINLNPNTIEKIVEELEHINFYKMDEDIHGRMFEIFLNATIRGKELGQYFTPRDIVNLMVQLADIQVNKDKIETVLDACCGSGGFLISAMNDMFKKVNGLVGLSNKEIEDMRKKIVNDSMLGIDAGTDPQIYRIARMNMYLHGDGGGNIYLADSLDKSISIVGRSDLEVEEELNELKEILITKNQKFDVILSNPPFSMRYSRDNKEQKDILDQYELSFSKKKVNSLLSSVMFLERYKDLVSENGIILAIIDESILSGKKYEFIREYIKATFIIIGIVSLPGDAFKRQGSRVKTSFLILRKRKEGEEQPHVFMDKSIYLGLTPKIANRIGINIDDLDIEKSKEIRRIVNNYNLFKKGIMTEHAIDNSKIEKRMDVKFCIGDNGRKKPDWLEVGYKVKPLSYVLNLVSNRMIEVVEDEKYELLKVTYEGEVLEAEAKEGSEISYSKLYKVYKWDILFSNMGVGRGAIGIVPIYYDNKYVSNEFTILNANTKEEALYYKGILRTKEILGDILSSATGMNRGRIKWDIMKNIEIPIYNSNVHNMKDAVISIENYWDKYSNYRKIKNEKLSNIIIEMKLEDEEATKRWLANKPPE